ncbi:HU family DNA-binding protein [Mycoplasma simbae]|uniref:HU family DNA-binding protein n=1 Tax=Mycoplasma simbae TaxID=36744 RepID=UPI00049621D0|nr:HU family DNA-binding protein [Mycoplasma simbae]
MTKKEFITEVAERMGVPVRIASDFFDKFVVVLKDKLVQGHKIQLSALGTFETSTREGRTTINPFTKETITVPSKKVVKFRVSKYLKDAVIEN